MSEPRKLYTGSASGGLDQEQYEAARRRAQQLAEQNARRRTVQQPMRTAQGRHISQRPVVTEQPAPAPEPPVQERAQQAAPAPEKPRELTYAQRQAMAYRAAAERRYGDTLQFQVQRPRRTVIKKRAVFCQEPPRRSGPRERAGFHGIPSLRWNKWQSSYKSNDTSFNIDCLPTWQSSPDWQTTYFASWAQVCHLGKVRFTALVR